MPADGPGAIKDRQGSAYTWAILVIVNSFLIIGIAPWFAAAMPAEAAAAIIEDRSVISFSDNAADAVVV